MFRGFKGTPTSIVTCVLGFLTICAGVVLLQLSKSAKDVPDAAVFKGDLDQIHELAEQEEPETEPRADAIRGTAAIARRFSTIRHKREIEEFKRLHDEKIQEQLETVVEDGAPQYEWDGIRRRRTTTFGSANSRQSGFVPPPRSPHPPLGMSRFPTEEELEEMRAASTSPGFLGTFTGSTRRSRAYTAGEDGRNEKQLLSPGRLVPLTRIAVPRDAHGNEMDHHGAAGQEQLGLPVSTATRPSHSAPGEMPNSPTSTAKRNFSFHHVFKWAHGSESRPGSSYGFRPRSPLGMPAPPQGTEEERLGLVKGDSHSKTRLPHRRSSAVPDVESEDSLDDDRSDDEKPTPVLVPATGLNATAYGSSFPEAPSPPRPTAPRVHSRGRSIGARSLERNLTDETQAEIERYEARRAQWNQSRSRGPPSSSRSSTPKGSARGADVNNGGMI